jgi:putative ABC transport system substrate-binding protein
MDRRTFIGAIASGLIVPWKVGEAQPTTRVYRVGFLSLPTADSTAPLHRAFDEALRDLGFVEGRNLVFERRYADGHQERLPGLAAELVRLPVDVIVAGTISSAVAAQHATTTIPIVMSNAIDPVGAGLVKSLARPGGNITGLSTDASQAMLAKHLALLKEINSKLSRVGVFRTVESEGRFAELQAAARQLNLGLEFVTIRTPDDFEGAFSAMAAKRVGAVLVAGGPVSYMRREQIGELALKHRLPAVTSLSEYVQAGVLVSYGPNLPDQFRRAAGYVAKILRGAKPADLPVEQPTKFDLVINLKTAKALGITIPKDVLLRADEVIQ